MQRTPFLSLIATWLYVCGCAVLMAAAATNEPADTELQDAASMTLSDDILDSIVIVRGKQGAGTGFIARQGSNVYLFSNIHVFMGNTGLSFANNRGTQFKPLALEAANDRDLVRVTIANAPAQALAIAEPRGINQPVIVCGNAEGEEVMRQMEGVLLGVGPTKVETSAKFVKGHSGSPILTTNGVVLGIATYVKRGNSNWVTTNTPFTVTRRFGYRVDNVPAWIRVSPDWFVAEGQRIVARERQLDAVSDLLDLWARDPYWRAIPDVEISPGITDWIQAHNEWVMMNRRVVQSARADSSKAQELSREFRRRLAREAENLKTEIQSMSRQPAPRWHIPFFTECWHDLNAWHTGLLKAIDYLQAMHSSYDPIVLRSRDQSDD